MSFTASNLLDYYKASMEGKTLPNVQYLNQKGRGMGSKKRRLIYNINQKGAGANLVSPIAQDFQQAKSMIKERNAIKRAASRSISPHKKRRRTVRKSPKKKVTKKKRKSTKKKTSKRIGRKTRTLKKGRKKRITKKDIFGK